MSDYIELYGCSKCQQFDRSKFECMIKEKFEDSDPTTCPSLFCPFFKWDYSRAISVEPGEVPIFYESDGTTFFPIDYWELTDDSQLCDLLRCDVIQQGNESIMRVHFKSIWRLHKAKKDITDTVNVSKIFAVD